VFSIHRRQCSLGIRMKATENNNLLLNSELRCYTFPAVSVKFAGVSRRTFELSAVGSVGPTLRHWRYAEFDLSFDLVR
jgi:hypothetical protein